MRIAVDAMGGDYAPEEIVKGALLAAQQLNIHILLVGDSEKVKPFLPKALSSNVTLFHASEIVTMDDSPVKAVVKKPDSSLVVAAKMVGAGEADALVTLGNTGAAVAVSKLLWGMIPGVERPAIATTMPTLSGHLTLLDSGATTDAEPEWLLQFAVMGGIFCEKVLGRSNPKIALLNIGEERGKGNIQVKKAYELFEKSVPNFVGNVEGKDIFTHEVDVVVCDGFVGNVLLKTGEGVVGFLTKLVKEELPKTPWQKLAFLPLFPAVFYKGKLKRLYKRIDHNEYGGAPLLGVKGVCIIGHGRSKEVAVNAAIREAAKAVETGLIQTIEQRVAPLHVETSEKTNV